MLAGGSGRAPGCGGGGSEGSAVVVAGTEAGVVRVGGGLAVWRVMPSGFAAIGEEGDGSSFEAVMGSLEWIGIGGIGGMMDDRTCMKDLAVFRASATALEERWI